MVVHAAESWISYFVFHMSGFKNTRTTWASFHKQCSDYQKDSHPSFTVCLFHDSWCINRETALTYRMSQYKEPQLVMNGRLKKWVITTTIHQHVPVHTDVHLCTEHAVRLHVAWFIAAKARSIKLHTHEESEKEWFITLKGSSSPTWLPIFTLTANWNSSVLVRDVNVYMRTVCANNSIIYVLICIFSFMLQNKGDFTWYTFIDFFPGNSRIFKNVLRESKSEGPVGNKKIYWK